jgi:hypothetical protein
MDDKLQQLPLEERIKLVEALWEEAATWYEAQRAG